MKTINVKKTDKIPPDFPCAMEYAGNVGDFGLVVIFLDYEKGFAVVSPGNRHPLNKIVNWQSCETPDWKLWHGEVTLKF